MAGSTQLKAICRMMMTRSQLGRKFVKTVEKTVPSALNSSPKETESISELAPEESEPTLDTVSGRVEKPFVEVQIKDGKDIEGLFHLNSSCRILQEQGFYRKALTPCAVCGGVDFKFTSGSIFKSMYGNRFHAFQNVEAFVRQIRIHSLKQCAYCYEDKAGSSAAPTGKRCRRP